MAAQGNRTKKGGIVVTFRGAGPMGDRRTKRNRDRGAQKRHAIREQH